MPAPKGHPPYGGETGGVYGYLGKPEDAWTKEELIEVGKGIVEYMKRKDTIWYSGFLATHGIPIRTWKYLKQKYSEILCPYIEIAAALQQEKLISMPFFKKADANHARLVLRQAHKEEFEETLNAHAKSEKAQDMGQVTINGLIEAARGIGSQAPGINQSIQSVMATDQSILDKGQERKADFVQP